jgi:hypothetical protein
MEIRHVYVLPHTEYNSAHRSVPVVVLSERIADRAKMASMFRCIFFFCAHAS